MRQFETGATRDKDDGKIHYKGFISPLAARAFGKYMESHRVQSDGNLREPDNWKKGIPLAAYEDSLVRHVFEWWETLEKPDEKDLEKAENLACAIFFNIQGWLHERMKEKTSQPSQ